MSLFALAFEDVMRRVVAPSAFVFLLIVGMLVAVHVTWRRMPDTATEDTDTLARATLALRDESDPRR